MSKTYKKKKEPLKYEVVFDGVEYSKEDQLYLWHQLIKTLLQLNAESLQS